LYVFQSLKFITSASTNFDLHILALSSVNLQWMPLKSLYDSTPSTHLRLSSALHWTSYLCSDFAQVLDVRWLGLVLVGGGSAFGSGKNVLDATCMFLMLCSQRYALNFLLDATLSTFSSKLNILQTYSSSEALNSLNSSNSQHALDATLLTLSSTFQHALCATVFTFSSNFNKNYINSLQCILKIFRQFQTSSDTFEQDNVGTQCAGGKLLQI
jgi:hypothetical protein